MEIQKPFITALTLLICGPALATDGDPLVTALSIDQLEHRQSGDQDGTALDAKAWIGRDLSKLWLTAEVENVQGETEEAEAQALFSRAISPYWDLQVGLRHDFRPSPSRTWGVIALQGLAPYFFEVDAALFVGESGRTALRLEAEYELRLTQRLILSPELELNLYGEDDPAVGVGSGLSDLEAGLRLRYEIRREFAPYVGLNRIRRFGESAELAREHGGSSGETQWVVGLRAWF